MVPVENSSCEAGTTALSRFAEFVDVVGEVAGFAACVERICGAAAGRGRGARQRSTFGRIDFFDDGTDCFVAAESDTTFGD